MTVSCLPSPSSGCCNGGGQGALVSGPSEESDVSGETAAWEPEPGRASTGASPGGEEHPEQGFRPLLAGTRVQN